MRRPYTVFCINPGALCRPTSVEPGPKVTPPFTETWEALEKCVEEGLVKSIGVSNFSPEKIQTFMPTAKIRPAVNQVLDYFPKALNVSMSVLSPSPPHQIIISTLGGPSL